MQEREDLPELPLPIYDEVLLFQNYYKNSENVCPKDDKSINIKVTDQSLPSLPSHCPQAPFPTRDIQSMESIIDDNRYQSIPIDINQSIDIDNQWLMAKIRVVIDCYRLLSIINTNR